MTNKWQSELGCEVNHCTASWCSPARMRGCALRQAYLERGRQLVRLLRELGDDDPVSKSKLMKQLRGMEWTEHESAISA